MSSRTFESGASKRRRKRQQTNEIKKCHGSMNRYLFNSNMDDVANPNESGMQRVDVDEVNTNNDGNAISDISQNYNKDMVDVANLNESGMQRVDVDEVKFNDDGDENNCVMSCNYISDVKTYNPDIDLDLNAAFPTDHGKFPETINNANLKRKIILFGPCKPNLKFLENTISHFDDINVKQRTFSTQYYFVMNPTGIKTPRSWLCYSVDLNKVYCETCWLFSDRKYPKFNLNWLNNLNDWQHLSQKIKLHKISIQHIDAVKVRILRVKHLIKSFTI